MSETKHTPGPWHVVEGAAYSQIEAMGGPLICFAASNNWDNKANARLIAAAPDLLETLTTGAVNMPNFLERIAARLVNVHGEDPNVDFVQTLRSRAKLCREAIAKATGDRT